MVRIFFLFRVRKKQVVMPAFFVPSLAGFRHNFISSSLFYTIYKYILRICIILKEQIRMMTPGPL